MNRKWFVAWKIDGDVVETACGRGQAELDSYLSACNAQGYDNAYSCNVSWS